MVRKFGLAIVIAFRSDALRDSPIAIILCRLSEVAVAGMTKMAIDAWSY